MNIQAELWIFGRITRDLSPTGKLGYQTLWASAGLLQAKRELEQVASSFDVEQKSRLQYFQLSDGRFALTAVRPSLDLQTVDRDGRQAFLCFGWIIAPSELQRCNFNPFAVYPPITSLLDIPALIEELGNPGTVVSTVTLPVRFPAPPRPSLPQDVVNRLAISGFRAGRGYMEDRPISLLGTPEECAQVLRWIIAHVPPSARAKCTFSTQTDQSSIPNRRFWMAGRTTREGQRSAFEVTLSSGLVRGYRTSRRESAAVRRFGLWLETRACAEQPSDDELEHLDLLLRALDGENKVDSSQIKSHAFVSELTDFFQDEVTYELSQRLAAFLPAGPAKIAAKVLQQQSDHETPVDLVINLLAKGTDHIGRSSLRTILHFGWADLHWIRRWWSKAKFSLRTSHLWFWRAPRLLVKLKRSGKKKRGLNQ